MKTTRTSWALPLALVFVLGCDQLVDTGADSGAPDTILADRGPGGEALPDQTAADGPATDRAGGDMDPARTVKVTYNGQSKNVDLSQPTPVTFGGAPAAKASDVVSIAFPALSQADLTADFMSTDGFKPGTKSNCSGLVPVPGANLAQGYINLADHQLAWETALGYPGCLNVKDLAEIQLADK